MIYASVCRDSRVIMDVAVYRLSKSVKRPNTTITHHLPDGFVRVMSGPLGMASIYDYDLVLMAASYLTEAMNRFRAGKGEKPDQVFRPRISDILTFCCKDDGGKQRKAIIGALERLSTTQVKIERVRNMGGEPMVITEGENLIGPFKVISNLRTQKLESVAFKVADWMYEDITTGHGPDVLSVNPDYFLLDGGLARFVYRMARKSAGKKGASWNFGTLYERSGSDSKRNEFNRMLRVIIKNNALPDYSLLEMQGKNDAVLHMENRAQVDKWKEAEE
ncbi:replication initiator protein A [Pseudomonas sp. 3A(2025)]